MCEERVEKKQRMSSSAPPPQLSEEWLAQNKREPASEGQAWQMKLAAPSIGEGSE